MDTSIIYFWQILVEISTNFGAGIVI